MGCFKMSQSNRPLSLVNDLYMFITMIIYWVSVLVLLKPLELIRKYLKLDILSPLIKLTKVIGNM
jgi:hypothetical protein